MEEAQAQLHEQVQVLKKTKATLRAKNKQQASDMEVITARVQDLDAVNQRMYHELHNVRRVVKKRGDSNYGREYQLLLNPLPLPFFFLNPPAFVSLLPPPPTITHLLFSLSRARMCSPCVGVICWFVQLSRSCVDADIAHAYKTQLDDAQVCLTLQQSLGRRRARGGGGCGGGCFDALSFLCCIVC